MLRSGAPVFAGLVADRIATGLEPEGIALLRPFVRATFAKLEPELRGRLERALLEAAAGTTAAQRSAVASESRVPSASGAVCAFLLRDLYESGAPLAPNTHSYAAALPAIKPIGVPTKQWLADGALTVRLFFYPDEKSIDATRAALVAKGFKRNNGYAKAHGLRPGKDTVLERTKGGVVQRVILSMDADERTKRAALRQPGVDIIAHRGHSYHLEETFPPDAELDNTHIKLIIGGSCGSLESMTRQKFLMAYGKHRLVADADTGEGAINDAVLLKILDSVAAGKTAWDRMGLESLEQERGIVAPDDPVFAALRYGEVIAAAWAK